MLTFLARRWFLLLLVSGLCVALLRPAWLRPAAEAVPMPLVVALSLFSMSVALEGRRLWLALGRPIGGARGVLISLVILPLLAIAVGPFLPLVDLRVGLLIMVSVPCTLSSAVLWTRQGGGDEAMALLLVMLTNGAGWLVTPFWLTTAGPLAVALDVRGLMLTLLLVLGVPVVAGQLLRLVRGVPAFIARWRVINSVVSRLLVAVTLIAAAVLAADRAGSLTLIQLGASIVACLGVHLTGVFLALEVGRLLGIGRGDR